MADLGTDFSLIGRFKRVSGTPNLIGAIQRRLSTPRGGLFYDETFGLDVRDYVQASWDAGTKYELERLTQAEVEQDPRVQSATVEASQTDLERILLKITGETAEGPFALVLSVSNVTVEVLRANA